MTKGGTRHQAFFLSYMQSEIFRTLRSPPEEYAKCRGEGEKEGRLAQLRPDIVQYGQ
jgi:hypothetical protein